jgi:hypothetical protein
MQICTKPPEDLISASIIGVRSFLHFAFLFTYVLYVFLPLFSIEKSHIIVILQKRGAVCEMYAAVWLPVMQQHLFVLFLSLVLAALRASSLHAPFSPPPHCTPLFTPCRLYMHCTGYSIANPRKCHSFS